MNGGDAVLEDVTERARQISPIAKRLQELQETPCSHDSIQLKGTRDFCLDAGKYCILYEINNEAQTVRVFRIMQCGEGDQEDLLPNARRGIRRAFSFPDGKAWCALPIIQRARHRGRALGLLAGEEGFEPSDNGEPPIAGCGDPGVHSKHG